MKYKAIFFDRDNTLTYIKPEISLWLKNTIESYSHKEYKMDYDGMIKLFNKSGYPKDGLKSVEDEIIF